MPHGLVDERIRGSVVSLQGCGRLGVTEGDEDMPNRASSLGVMKKRRCFCFRRAGDNMSDGFTLSKYWTIGRGNAGWRAGAAEKEMAGESTASTW